MTEKTFVLDNGMTLKALCWGKGEPVLALHGWMDNAASFSALAEHWQYGQLVALDLPGHGHSDHRQGAYYFVDYLFEIYQVVQQLGAPVHLLGHSMGAMLSVTFAGVFPELVKSIQLIDGILPITTAPEQALQTVKGAILSRLKHDNRQGRVYASLAAMAKVRSQNGDFSAEQALPLVTRASIKRDDGYHWLTDPKLKATSPLRLTETQAKALVAGCACPVRLFLGTEGMYSQDEARLNREMAVLNIDKPNWIDGGHHCHLQSPVTLALQLEQQLTLT
ncbi:alpha/beta fold hydrolase [Gallaecimonas mangrovi]|uniref:alpha/beta fold hydrolase n=1 Tax=Gallaecimonas mangrovi TaxID=2291597 RepID=UPI00186747DA|nr:alpha/beta hydrolase [Gallaecimonas mangrovi]